MKWSKRIEYCFGNGLELLSAILMFAVCQDSKVFRIRKIPLSVTLVNYSFIKSIEWLLRQAWAAIFELVLHIFTSNVFIFLRWKTPSGLTNVAPRTTGARNFIHHISLKFKRGPKLGGKEFLLQGLVKSSNNVNFHSFEEDVWGVLWHHEDKEGEPWRRIYFPSNWKTRSLVKE